MHRLVQEDTDISINAGYTDFMTSFADLRSQEKAVRLADENYSVVRNRYENDLALLTDMLDAGNIQESEAYAGMEKRQGRHSLDIRKTHPFHALIIKFFRKKILFYLILYLNLRRKIPEWGLHVTIY